MSHPMPAIARAAALFLLAFLSSACSSGGDGGDDCEVGTLGCACAPGDACIGNQHECISGVCVGPDERRPDAGGGMGGDGDTAVQGPGADAGMGDGDTGEGPEPDAGGGGAGEDGCEAGFARDADGECQDIDECADDHGGCDPNATCSDADTPGAEPLCACGASFVGDGLSCALRARSVSIGSEHACAIGFDGGLYCWGSHEYGQLGIGDGRIGERAVLPTRVGDQDDWDEVSAGASHTCAIRAGQLYCFGRGANGRLGLGGAEVDVDHGSPMVIAGDDWFGLSAGAIESCALRGTPGAGQILCWGALSDGNAGPAPVPFGSPDARFVQVQTSGRHVCAIRDDGALLCWGENFSGQLGVGDAEKRTTPTQVGSALDWSAVAVGNQTSCGLRGTGELWCFGDPSYLPDGSFGVSVTAPEQYGVWNDWVEVSLGNGGGPVGCARRAGGIAYCWGWNDKAEAGQTPHPMDSIAPLTQLGTAEQGSWSQVAAGDGSSCGIRDDRVYCWGSNDHGKLGTITELRSQVEVPTRVGSDADWSVVSAGGGASCGIRAGQLHCWGWRSDDDSLAPTPTRIGGDNDWTDVITGYVGGSLGIQGTQVYRWGGIARDPVTLEDGSFTWSKLAMGRGALPQSWSAHSRCGIRGTDTLLCWGENGSGQLGVGDTADRTEPTAVTGAWVSVTQGTEHTCAINTIGELYCWGDAGNVGTNAAMDETAPVRVVDQTGWTQVVAYGRATCGIRNGALYCWEAAPPAQIGFDTDWSAVSHWEGLSHCGIRSGALFCWGSNGEGQLGIDNGRMAVAEPMLVDDGSSSQWQRVSMGDRFACGIRGDGSLWCWGRNDWGQTGTGPSWSETPRAIDLPLP